MRVCNLIGLFFKTNSPNPVELQVCDEDEGNTLSVRSQLEPFEGQVVRLIAHHFPPNPPRPGAWALGACYFMGARCPYGHDAEHGDLFHVDVSGVLRHLEDGKYQIANQEVDLTVLEGHRSRLLMVTEVPKVPDPLEIGSLENLEGMSLDELLAKSKALSEHLTLLKNMAREIDV